MKTLRYYYSAIGWFVGFLVFTLSLKIIDVRPILMCDMDNNPVEKLAKEPKVGWFALNSFVHNATGVSNDWYSITKYIGLLSFAMVAVFAGLGIWQLIQRKSLKKVDQDLMVLAVTYFITFVFYILFDLIPINYRPVILDIEEGLEASFPSTHTLLAVVIFSTAILQIRRRLKEPAVKNILTVVCLTFMFLIVGGRLISGVHWFTDIVGGIILGAAIICFYKGSCRWYRAVRKRKRKAMKTNSES